MNIDIHQPVTKLKNVGPARATALSRLDIKSIGDLLCLYPRAYENRGEIRLLSDSIEGEKQALCLVIATSPKKALIRRGMSLLKFRAYDDSATVEITYFNQDYLAEKFVPGKVFRFYGKVDRKKMPSGKDIFSMSSPAAELVNEEIGELPPLIPIYPLTEGLNQNLISKLIGEVLTSGHIKDPLPEEIRMRNELATRSFALKNIHSPSSLGDLSAARKRLVFDEFFNFALGISLSGKDKKTIVGAHPCSEADISSLIGLLPYSLTSAQEKVISEIARDMSKSTPMSRLLVGDVGCGKTVCAAAAMFIAVKSGMQAALMAPTEILASQHYNDLKSLMEKLNIRVRLLTGSTSAAEKRRIYAEMAAKETGERVDIVIGTHALLSDGVKFSSLGLVVTDEQHRFGVKQRSALSLKGNFPHMLVMSATPIPRSLALTIYGDLDLSIIDEMPPGRQRVDTFYVDESYRSRLLAFIDKLTAEGGQVYVVCPAVEEKAEENEDEKNELTIDELLSTEEFSYGEEKSYVPPLRSAVQYAKTLSESLPHLNIAFVHGKMKSAEKDATMRAFSEGEIDVLVSTTVIEVGVNVPNACLMIVENAERFGLSQLHQLRGRVGRGGRKSYCVLVSDSKGENARTRLDTMKNIYDGFTIAEKDLAMRGPGDFLKSAAKAEIRQSGALRFRLGDMCNDSLLLSAAFREAKALINGGEPQSGIKEILSEVNGLFDVENNY